MFVPGHEEYDPGVVVVQMPRGGPQVLSTVSKLNAAFMSTDCVEINKQPSSRYTCHVQDADLGSKYHHGVDLHVNKMKSNLLISGDELGHQIVLYLLTSKQGTLHQSPPEHQPPA